MILLEADDSQGRGSDKRCAALRNVHLRRTVAAALSAAVTSTNLQETAPN